MMTGYPMCLVEIHGAEETFELSTDPGQPFGQSPSGDLLSCTTHKRLDMGSPAGQFELQLVRAKDAQGRTWMEKIRPQDMVVIQMINHRGVTGPDGAGELHTVMIGWVDHVRDFTAVNAQGKPERRVRVIGRDAGKLLSSGQVTWWNFVGANLLRAQKFIDVSRFNAKPASVVRDLIEEIYHRFVRATVQYHGEPRDFWDLLAYSLDSYDAEIPAGLDYRFISGEGTFWSFLSAVASAPFHELFVDTRRQSFVRTAADLFAKTPVWSVGKDQSSPTLILRPTPFPFIEEQPVRTPSDPVQIGLRVAFSATQPLKLLKRERWDALVRHEIGIHDGVREEPIMSEVERSGDAQPNVYMPRPIYPMIPDQMFSLAIPPILDRVRFHRYGYRPYMPDCSMIQPSGPGDRTEPIMDWYTKLAWQVASWNVLNDQFLSGTKVLQLSPHLHVGERIVDRSSWHEQAYEFYIESVSHQWAYQGRANTTIGVTRGLPETDYVRIVQRPEWLNLEKVDVTDTTRTFTDLFETAQRK